VERREQVAALEIVVAAAQFEIPSVVPSRACTATFPRAQMRPGLILQLL
jgi:hypothetical protein